MEAIADDADMELFCKMANPRHCFHSLLPPIKSRNHYLRPKGHIISSSSSYLLTYSPRRSGLIQSGGKNAQTVEKERHTIAHSVSARTRQTSERAQSPDRRRQTAEQRRRGK